MVSHDYSYDALFDVVGFSKQLTMVERLLRGHKTSLVAAEETPSYGRLQQSRMESLTESVYASGQAILDTSYS